MSAKLINTYAPLPVVKRGAPIQLGFDAKSGNMLYAAGNCVVIRNVANPLQSDLYYEHSCQPTVAKYAPSGYYIASGDVQGNVRIWDTTQKEHPLKLELRVLSGAVNDIAWSGDSGRLLVVGDGKERFGAVFVWDAGSSVGEIAGHSKPLISADFKPTRPFRVATSGEDSLVNWFEGPPFKFKKSNRDHQRMVTSVRFSADGNKLASGATDKKVVVYDGKTGDKLGEFEGHKGGVYGVSWAPDSTRFATCSADKSVAIWNSAEGNKELARVQFGGDKAGVEHQQLGCIWTVDQTLLSVNLEGEINYIDPATAAVTRVVHGHNKAITALTCGPNNTFYSGSYDGKIIKWDASTGENWNFQGTGHSNQVNQIALQGKMLVTCAMDNTLRITDTETLKYDLSVSLDNPCVGVAVGLTRQDLVVVATMTGLFVVIGGKVTCSLPIKYTASCVALSVNEKEIVVGGKDDKAIHVYELDVASGVAKETRTITEGIRGALTCLTYSPDGLHLASADTSRNIFVWDVATKQIKIQNWIFHSARVNSLAWTADSQHLASAGLDSGVYVWSVATPDKRVFIKNAHPSGVNGVSWLNADTLISCGQDSAIKSWSISF